jgi:urease accessory protein
MGTSSPAICRFEVRRSGSPEVRKSGSIRCERVGSLSVLTGVEAGDPLKLIPLRGRGPSCTVCVATYGGGFVAGDCVRLDVTVGAAAKLALTTQANGKAYRSDDGRWASSTVESHIAADGCLAILPDPLTPFARARFHQQQTLHLDTLANAVVLDWFVTGRVARGESWAFDALKLNTDIHRNNLPLVCERLSLDAASGAGLGNLTCLGSLIVVGPHLAAFHNALAAAVAEHPLAVNQLRLTWSGQGDLGVLRFAAISSEMVLAWLRRHGAHLNEALGQDPWMGRL